MGKREPAVRQIAAHILRNVPVRDWKKEAVACFNWVRDKIRYTLDPYDVELFQSASRSISEGIGDCDDQSIVLCSLLQSIGIPVRLRVIGLKGSRQFSHIYVLAGLPPDAPSEWLPLDPARPEDPGWELPKEKRGLLRDFEVDDLDPSEFKGGF